MISNNNANKSSSYAVVTLSEVGSKNTQSQLEEAASAHLSTTNAPPPPRQLEHSPCVQRFYNQIFMNALHIRYHHSRLRMTPLRNTPGAWHGPELAPAAVNQSAGTRKIPAPYPPTAYYECPQEAYPPPIYPPTYCPPLTHYLAPYSRTYYQSTHPPPPSSTSASSVSKSTADTVPPTVTPSRPTIVPAATNADKNHLIDSSSDETPEIQAETNVVDFCVSDLGAAADKAVTANNRTIAAYIAHARKEILLGASSNIADETILAFRNKFNAAASSDKSSTTNVHGVVANTTAASVEGFNSNVVEATCWIQIGASSRAGIKRCRVGGIAKPKKKRFRSNSFLGTNTVSVPLQGQVKLVCASDCEKW